jgi:hypothetical protein
LSDTEIEDGEPTEEPTIETPADLNTSTDDKLPISEQTADEQADASAQTSNTDAGTVAPLEVQPLDNTGNIDYQTIAQNKLTERGLGAANIVEDVFDHRENPRYLLAESNVGYLIYDKQSGIVMEWAESRSPYNGYTNKKYYGGYGLYFIEQAGAYFDIQHQAVVNEVGYLYTIEDLEPAAQQPSTGAISPLASSTQKQLPNTYDYIQRLSFGNNAGADANSCTAVAIQLALNYLDKTVDGRIVPAGYESDSLSTTTPDWNQGYARTNVMFRFLLDRCLLAPKYFFTFTPGVWGGQAQEGVYLYSINSGTDSAVRLRMSFTLVDQWNYVTAEIDKGLPALVTTPPWGESQYPAHTMLVSGYDNSRGQRDYQVHNGWYGDNNIPIGAGAHKIVNISSAQPVISYRFGFIAGWHTNANNMTRYYNSDCSYKTGWHTISGKLYYFDANGYRQNGWKTINGATYYFGSDGAAYTGWKFVGSDPCRFSDQGQLLDRKFHLAFPSGLLINIMPDLNVYRTCLDIESGSNIAGAKVQVYVNNYTKAQLFELVSVTVNSVQAYQIKNVSSGLVLQPTGGIPFAGARLIQAAQNYTNYQAWVFVADTNTSSAPFRIVNVANPALAVEVAGGKTTNGTAVQMAGRANSKAQMFWLPSRTPIANGDYKVQSLISGKVLDVAGGSALAGANVQVYTANGTAAQKFRFTIDRSSGYYTITNAISGKVLDVSNGSTALGANVQVYVPNNTIAQKWVIYYCVGDYYQIINPSTGYVLDVASGSSAAGANVQMYVVNGTVAQRWSVVKV